MSVAAHDNCAFVLKRVANGDRVRFFQDFYGVHYAEVVPKWMFWRRARVRLDLIEKYIRENYKIKAQFVEQKEMLGQAHAIALARELGITRVVVPRYPGVLSAHGLLAAPIEHEASAAFSRPLAGLDLASVRAGLAELDTRCRTLMQSEAIDPSRAVIRHYADVCYVGQSYHLEIPFNADAPQALDRLYRDFLVAHNRVYGHSTESPARIVNLRSVHQVPSAAEFSEAAVGGGQAKTGTRRILVGDGDSCEATIYDRAALAVGQKIAGPAIVEQTDTTVLIEPGWRGRVHPAGALILTPA